MAEPRKRTRKELHQQRRRRPHSCWDRLICAPLWPKYGVNLGTVLRTCDAVGACLAVPRLRWVPEALGKGSRLAPCASCIHWVNDPATWLAAQRATARIVGVELVDESIRLADLPPARERTVVVLGHERDGIPAEAMQHLDVAVEIPMIGIGTTLNVAVAGSLVLYRLSGFL